MYEESEKFSESKSSDWGCCLNFVSFLGQFEPGDAHKSVAFKKACSSIELLIHFTNFVMSIHVFFVSNSIFYFSLEYLWSHEFSVWKLPSNCFFNSLSASGCLMISATWLINFQMVHLFYMSLSSLYLFSIQQLRKLITEM